MPTYALKLAACLGAFVTACWAVDQLRLALRSRRWPAAVATITRSERLAKTDGEGATCWEPQIEYAFTVGDTEFRGRRLRFGAGSATTGHEAERICRRYVAGTQVSVRFNPRDPYEAALEPGAGGEVIPPFIYAVVLAFLAWFL